MFNSPGFVEYVMDRSVERDKASKDAKYELVKALANSKTIAEIFGNPNYLRLRTYLSEGPYYVKPISTTAVEGAEWLLPESRPLFFFLPNLLLSHLTPSVIYKTETSLPPELSWSI